MIPRYRGAYKKRGWEPREMRYVAEWVTAKFPGARVIYRCRLGSLRPEAQLKGLTEAERKLYTVYKYWADAIVITEREIILVEGKLRPKPGVISQIELYLRLIPQTEELKPYAHLPRRVILLMATPEWYVIELAKEKGIEVIIWSPAWAEQYLKELGKFTTAGKQYF